MTTSEICNKMPAAGQQLELRRTLNDGTASQNQEAVGLL
jgi:hypothetical protein